MKRQRNTTQMKEQTRNTEVQKNVKEIGKLLEKEFIMMIVKMNKNLENKMEKMQESIKKDLEDFIILGSKITADGDCNHEIKRHLLLEGKLNSFLEPWEKETSNKIS